MRGLERIAENKAINAWARRFRRHPGQRNRTHEADAELVELPGDPDHLLAVTIDTVSEEIATGLYQNPYTMGWVAVMAAASDLAAVGARPLGLLVSVSLEPDRDEAFTGEIARGMEEACRSLGLFILGGDTNTSPAPSLSACAFGWVPRERMVTRTGCGEGDALFLSGPAGIGNALGLVRLMGLPEDYFPENHYRPVAQLAWGELIRDYATCCMDTSDGVLATLDQLMRLNERGFVLERPWTEVLDPKATALCERTDTPPWLMGAGPHGEFVLAFCVREQDVEDFLAACKERAMNPIRLGSVSSTMAIAYRPDAKPSTTIDMVQIRNMTGRLCENPEMLDAALARGLL
jgi:thiamine-monophosphate kinase